MRIAPTDPRIQLELWNVYSAQEMHDRALEAANSVPPGSPLFRRARFAVAQSLIALKRFDGAIHELEALHKTEPSAAVSNAIGIGQLRRGSAEGGSPAADILRAGGQRGSREHDVSLQPGLRARALREQRGGARIAA